MSTIIIGSSLTNGIFFSTVDSVLDDMVMGGISIYGSQVYSTDPIGSTIVTLSGVHAGCEVRIRDKDTNELAGTESCVENPSFTWSVYAAGSPYNTVRIVVISTDYELIDLQYTVSVGSFSIPIEMREDPWFKDPV